MRISPPVPKSVFSAVRALDFAHTGTAENGEPQLHDQRQGLVETAAALNKGGAGFSKLPSPGVTTTEPDIDLRPNYTINWTLAAG